MPTGQVKWFDTKKGYGFIIGDAGQDVFVHYTCIVGDGFRSLKDGEIVDYEMLESDKGFQARNVRRQSAPATGETPAKPARPDGAAKLAADRPDGHARVAADPSGGVSRPPANPSAGLGDATSGRPD